jgi:hypothetical protein
MAAAVPFSRRSAFRSPRKKPCYIRNDSVIETPTEKLILTPSRGFPQTFFCPGTVKTNEPMKDAHDAAGTVREIDDRSTPSLPRLFSG